MMPTTTTSTDHRERRDRHRIPPRPEATAAVQESLDRRDQGGT